MERCECQLHRRAGGRLRGNDAPTYGEYRAADVAEEQNHHEDLDPQRVAANMVRTWVDFAGARTAELTAGSD